MYRDRDQSLSETEDYKKNVKPFVDIGWQVGVCHNTTQPGQKTKLIGWTITSPQKLKKVVS